MRSLSRTRVGLLLGVLLLGLLGFSALTSAERMVAAQDAVSPPKSDKPTAAQDPKTAEADDKKKGDQGDTAKDDTGGLPAGPDARGFLKLGTVRFHPQRKEIEADGWFNLRGGFIEFLACMPERKAHETLVSLDIMAEHLHAALLLLELKPGKPPETETDTRAIAGDRVVIELRWQQKGKDGKVEVVQKRAEECIFNGLVSESMERCGFVFTGSQFLQERLIPPSAMGKAPPGTPREEVPADGEGKPQPAGGKTEAGGDDSAGGKSSAGASDAADDKAKEGDDKGSDADDPAKRPEFREVFGAAVTGQLIALSHRPLAILDNPLQLPFPDADYYADHEVIPPLDRENPTEVTLIIRLPREGDIDYSIKRMKVPPRRPRPDLPDDPPPGGDEEQKGSGEEGGSGSSFP